MLKFRNLNDSNEAVVGIVVTVLIIGLIISVFSIIQLAYMPQWQEQREADHMHDVAYQFSQLKYTIDVLSTIGQRNSISTYINLGIPDYPILGSGKTYDSINIFTDNCTITFSNATDTTTFSIGSIKFSSKNSRFVDQSYIFEAGSLILSQSRSSLLVGKPFLSVMNFTNVSLSLVNISGLDGKRSAGGYGTYSVYMEYYDSNNYLMNDVSSIRVSTYYKNAWRTFFNSTTLRYSGLTYTINDFSNGLIIDFSGVLGNFDIEFVEIFTQIAPGWIE